ncbi:hypothetical protein Zmor_021056 [Zophobas morio]|uniref:Uncharacterized protein n=1 Tax=Zophobas morio TaxID=2755281 RepID=A0AA38I4W8_9CUCU|nr:hypothetical protein Zmor_021056 [Zophobas morio]
MADVNFESFNPSVDDVVVGCSGILSFNSGNTGEMNSNGTHERSPQNTPARINENIRLLLLDHSYKSEYKKLNSQNLPTAPMEAASRWTGLLAIFGRRRR